MFNPYRYRQAAIVLTAVLLGASIGNAQAAKAKVRAKTTGHFSVSAPDQPGLLWAVCRLLADQGVNIQAAWVSGDDDRVNDVFVVRGFPDLPQLERRLSREERPLHERIGGMLVGGTKSLVGR